MFVLGIDPGLTATGMVLYDSYTEEVLASQTWRGKRRRGALTDSEWLQQIGELSKAVRRFVIAAEASLSLTADEYVLAIETAAGVRASVQGRSHAAMMSVYGATGAVAAAVSTLTRCTRILGAHVQEVREAITGNRNASKQDVQLYLGIRRLRGAEQLQSSHEWDALAVAIYAASLINLERRSKS